MQVKEGDTATRHRAGPRACSRAGYGLRCGPPSTEPHRHAAVALGHARSGVFRRPPQPTAPLRDAGARRGVARYTRVVGQSARAGGWAVRGGVAGTRRVPKAQAAEGGGISMIRSSVDFALSGLKKSIMEPPPRPSAWAVIDCPFRARMKTISGRGIVVKLEDDSP